MITTELLMDYGTRPDGASERSLVAIVTPHHRLPLTEEEEISLRHLRYYLGRYDRFLIGPQDVIRNAPGAGLGDFLTCSFPEQYFNNIETYSRLLLSDEFYEPFAAYEYILIYQLDCLVFSDNLEAWCHAGWDYIGAPWFKGYGKDSSQGFWAVGNGGLSLRKVSSALKTLSPSRRLLDDPQIRASETQYFAHTPALRRTLVAFRTALLQLGYWNTPDWFLRQMRSRPNFNEDLFWAFYAQRLMPEFRIPAPQQALPFAFEADPRYCFEANANQLPFGCHAWSKWDRKFWEPFLLK